MRMNVPRTWRSLEIDMQPDSESSAHPVDRVRPQPMAFIKRIAVSMHALAIELAPRINFPRVATIRNMEFHPLRPKYALYSHEFQLARLRSPSTSDWAI
jgi:hypothetical protein